MDSMNQWLLAEQAGVRTLAGKVFDENLNVLQYPEEHAAQSIASSATLLKVKVCMYIYAHVLHAQLKWVFIFLCMYVI